MIRRALGSEYPPRHSAPLTRRSGSLLLLLSLRRAKPPPAALPFQLIADPDWALYRRFGVEHRLGSLLSARALRAAMAGEATAFGTRKTKRGAVGPIKPTGGRLGLPADFLIAPDGRVVALKYGRHAYDQWTVDELLDHAHAIGT